MDKLESGIKAWPSKAAPPPAAPPPRARPAGRHRTLAAAAAVAAALLVAYALGGAAARRQGADSGAPAPQQQQQQQQQQQPAPPPAGPAFTCPDGRRGLHVVSTRFMVGQAGAAATFVASRLLLMQTFMVPFLAAQTDARFALVVAVDERIPPGVEAALRGVLAPVAARAPVAYLRVRPTRGPKNYGASYAQARAVLAAEGLYPAAAPAPDLFLASRIDGDDAAGVGAVAALHAQACGPAMAGRHVRAVYSQAGLLWYPGAGPGPAAGAAARAAEAPHGRTAPFSARRRDGRPRPEPQEDLPFPTAMETLVVNTAAAPARRCAALSVYAHVHTKPWTLADVLADACPAVRFDRRLDIGHADVPEGRHGFVWTRSPASKSLKYGRKVPASTAPANATELAASFGVDPGQVAVAAALFAGLADEAPHTLETETLW